MYRFKHAFEYPKWVLMDNKINQLINFLQLNILKLCNKIFHIVTQVMNVYYVTQCRNLNLRNEKE